MAIKTLIGSAILTHSALPRNRRTPLLPIHDISLPTHYSAVLGKFA